MPARSSVLTGAAGEDYVLYRLHLEGLLAAQSPSGAWVADVLVFDPRMSVGSMLQVKTRTRGADGGWHMRDKHEGGEYVHPRLFYAFVDLEPASPVVYVIPSKVVADVIKKAHKTWLATPGKGGRAHRPHSMRRLRPTYPFAVRGYPPGWLDQYKERWDLLGGTASKTRVRTVPRRRGRQAADE